ncbi:MAG: hypothetical protein KBS76_00950, partial [Ruminococcus sp.]|nr:hypothetical protein [Candidatus Apopatosoma intestinale]
VGSDLTFDFERYADICEMAYANTHDEFFLQMLIHVMNRRRYPFHFPMTVMQAIQYPELKDLDLTEKPMPELPESFHVFYPSSRIVRARKDGVTCSLLGNHPAFLNVTVGNYTVSVRLCSAFFAIAQFTGETMEEVAPGQYRMTLHATADYKLPFDEAPEGSEDYWSMDYQSRKSIARCDYFYTVDVTFRQNGITLHVSATGTDAVPMKLEFFFTPGLHVRAGDVMTVGSADGLLCAKSGDVRLSAPSGEAFTLRGAFAKHFYHRDMRGSLPVPKGKFAVYMTDFSPADHTVEILCESAHPWDFYD